MVRRLSYRLTIAWIAVFALLAQAAAPRLDGAAHHTDVGAGFHWPVCSTATDESSPSGHPIDQHDHADGVACVLCCLATDSDQAAALPATVIAYPLLVSSVYLAIPQPVFLDRPFAHSSLARAPPLA